MTLNQNPEQKARDNIDKLLLQSGWIVQNKNKINFDEGIGQAVREYQTDVGPADYVLFVGKQAVGVIEAKKDNFTNGWTQCCLDMIKIRELNQNETMTVYGLVTNGEVWEVGKLEKQKFVLYRKRFFIEELENLFNGLISVLELCKLQLIELKLV